MLKNRDENWFGYSLISKIFHWFWVTEENPLMLQTAWSYTDHRIFSSKMIIVLRSNIHHCEKISFVSDSINNLWCFHLYKKVIWHYMRECICHDGINTDLHTSAPSKVVWKATLFSLFSIKLQNDIICPTALIETSSSTQLHNERVIKSVMRPLVGWRWKRTSSITCWPWTVLRSEQEHHGMTCLLIMEGS